MKIALVLVASAALSLAPFQCPGDPDPQMRREESAPEAVWMLSQQLGRQGHARARVDALRFLVRRYPSSRYAERARLELRRSPSSAQAPARPAQ